jgi:hypothetical protein
LRTYWIKLSDGSYPLGIRLGIGVTAYDREDALRIVRECIFDSDSMPETEEVIEDVDMSQLDQNHVLPNIGLPFQRGIWYPQGCSQPPEC